MTLARAKIVVAHSNQLMEEYHGDDEVYDNNKRQNEVFLDNLLTVLAHDMAEAERDVTETWK